MSARLISLSVALGCVLAMAARPSGAGPAAPPDGLAGNYYRLPASGLVVAIAHCGGEQLCGRVAAPGKRAGAGTAEARAERGGRCGATVVSELHPSGQGGWEGVFRDLDSGRDYWLVLAPKARLTPSASLAAAALVAQRYTSPPLLSGAMPALETWNRVAATAATCAAVTPSS